MLLVRDHTTGKINSIFKIKYHLIVAFMMVGESADYHVAPQSPTVHFGYNQVTVNALAYDLHNIESSSDALCGRLHLLGF